MHKPRKRKQALTPEARAELLKSCLHLMRQNDTTKIREVSHTEPGKEETYTVHPQWMSRAGILVLIQEGVLRHSLLHESEGRRVAEFELIEQGA